MTPEPENKARLEAQLAELEERRKRIAGDLAEPLNADSSEQAVEVEDDAGLEAEQRLVDHEIAAVRGALHRIKDGSYGTCVRCGDAIDPRRLEAQPEAALCIGCAQAA